MNKTTSPSKAKVRIISSSNAPVIYAEGMTQFVLGFPNSRILLSGFSQKSTADDAEEDIQQPACELVMPTMAIAEIAATIFAILDENKDALTQAGNKVVENLINTIENRKKRSGTIAEL